MKYHVSFREKQDLARREKVRLDLAWQGKVRHEGLPSYREGAQLNP